MTTRGCLGLLLALTLGLTGCLGESPEERARREQDRLCASERECEDGDPEHRPGQFCLLCHGPDYAAEGARFALAGTVYLRKGDLTGVEAARVALRDAAGREFDVLTNRTGNFMISVEPGLDQPRDRGRGQLAIPFPPSYPIEVSVTASSREIKMRSRIQREGSCNACHSPPESPSSPGRIYVLETP